MSTPEVIHPTEKSTEVLSDAAGKRAEELRNLEAEQTPENKAEALDNARHETEAAFSKEAGKENRQGGEPSAPRAVHKVTKNERAAGYRQTMQHIRGEMSAPARTFSKIIHAPIVERSSEVIGGTLARPNAILAGSTTALVLVISVYVIARAFGYQLSGFETIGAFLLGWVLGLAYDYVRVMALGRHS